MDGLGEAQPAFVPADVLQHRVGEDEVVPPFGDVRRQRARVADRHVHPVGSGLVERRDVDDVDVLRVHRRAEPGRRLTAEVENRHPVEIGKYAKEPRPAARPLPSRPRVGSLDEPAAERLEQIGTLRHPASPLPHCHQSDRTRTTAVTVAR
jgi:hypothetical protein